LIRAVAKSISDSLRATDWLARSGTSSLTIVLPGCQPGHMEQIAHENLNRIASIQISSIDGLEIHPHAYVGGAAFVRGYPDSDAFLSKLADALDNAKALGPGHVVIQRINPWLRSQSVA
jgi:GGDEF domain-containing protein